LLTISRQVTNASNLQEEKSNCKALDCFLSFQMRFDIKQG